VLIRGPEGSSVKGEKWGKRTSGVSGKNPAKNQLSKKRAEVHKCHQLKKNVSREVAKGINRVYRDFKGRCLVTGGEKAGILEMAGSLVWGRSPNEKCLTASKEKSN